MNRALVVGLLILTHAGFAAGGFALGIYVLPILTAPDAPAEPLLRSMTQAASYTGQFRRDLQDSDALHWGEGTLYVGSDMIAFEGELAPGPDYRLYLAPRFIETEQEFLAELDTMVEVGPVRSFGNFVLPVPESINPDDYVAAIVWCKAFGQFITAAQYRE